MLFLNAQNAVNQGWKRSAAGRDFVMRAKSDFQFVPLEYIVMDFDFNFKAMTPEWITQ